MGVGKFFPSSPFKIDFSIETTFSQIHLAGQSGLTKSLQCRNNYFQINSRSPNSRLIVLKYVFQASFFCVSGIRRLKISLQSPRLILSGKGCILYSSKYSLDLFPLPYLTVEEIQFFRAAEL
jgi:hypothetical protein